MNGLFNRLVPSQAFSWSTLALGGGLAGMLLGGPLPNSDTAKQSEDGARAQVTVGANPSLISSGSYTVFGYNDLGMHCLNEDFSEICILPPANTLRAQVIRKGNEPIIATTNLLVTYNIPGNTKSSTKTNFWKYDKALFGVDLPIDKGLFGYGLSGNMHATADRDYIAQGIPLTPMQDSGLWDPYQLSQITVRLSGNIVAATQAVVPVSWELNCAMCHKPTGVGFSKSVASAILLSHDKLHNTSLILQKPVLCAKCHADPALGAVGTKGVSTLSGAMHTAHATRVAALSPTRKCYACHPGSRTQCLRDIHRSKGMNCVQCHISMTALGSPTRTPWVNEPRCGTCHQIPGHEYEQPNVLFRNSVGHNGVKCITCHGSPHAITPSMNARDNVQAIGLQGKAGVINKCTLCHAKLPNEAFNHTRSN